MNQYKSIFKEENNSIFHGCTLDRGLSNVKLNRLKAGYFNEYKWVSFATSLKYFFTGHNNMPSRPSIIFELDYSILKRSGFTVKAPKDEVEKGEVIIVIKVLPKLQSYTRTLYVVKKELEWELKSNQSDLMEFFKVEREVTREDIFSFFKRKGFTTIKEI